MMPSPLQVTWHPGKDLGYSQVVVVLNISNKVPRDQVNYYLRAVLENYGDTPYTDGQPKEG